MTISHGSRITVALLGSIVAGVVWIAWSEGQWRGRSELHYQHCEQRVNEIDARLKVIENWMLVAREVHPGVTR